MKRYGFFYALLFLILIFGCQQKQEKSSEDIQKQFTPVQKPIQAPMTEAKREEKPVSPHSNITSKERRRIVLSDEIKRSWSSVRLVFEDRGTNRQTELLVKLGKEFNIANTDLKIICKEFIPDFKMDKDIITSKSNEPNNPAVQVIIYERGKAIFEGWLYAKYPEIHSFQHQRYSITLREGIRG
ncbi:MAG: DUF2155 domain-containing protein [Thermodesulfovibrionales bacterium]|nr:DUF2155 domain-containing protein [Thermodesulfovibrionales bacterium]